MVAEPITKEIYNQKIIVAPSAGTQLTIHRTTGVDTASDIYLNFDISARKIVFAPLVAFVITEYNGKVLDYPIKVHALKKWTDTRNLQIHDMKIHTLGDTNYIRVFLGGFT